jgi:DNA-binding transcriptional regulator YhcF (GntR family)
LTRSEHRPNRRRALVTPDQASKNAKAVGGQPLGWVSELSRDYKLLSVSDPMAARLTTVFDKTTLTYRNLGQEGVQAVAVQAMLVTRNYTSKSKREQLQMIHDKLANVVGDIRETRGTHPKWGEIDPTATTDKWPMYLTAKQ